jgi:hypothetical protein
MSTHSPTLAHTSSTAPALDIAAADSTAWLRNQTTAKGADFAKRTPPDDKKNPSTGPRTQTGKAVSSRNAFTNGTMAPHPGIIVEMGVRGRLGRAHGTDRHLAPDKEFVPG